MEANFELKQKQLAELENAFVILRTWQKQMDRSNAKCAKLWRQIGSPSTSMSDKIKLRDKFLELEAKAKVVCDNLYAAQAETERLQSVFNGQ